MRSIIRYIIILAQKERDGADKQIINDYVSCSLPLCFEMFASSCVSDSSTSSRTLQVRTSCLSKGINSIETECNRIWTCLPCLKTGKGQYLPGCTTHTMPLPARILKEMYPTQASLLTEYSPLRHSPSIFMSRVEWRVKGNRWIRTLW